MSKLGWWKFVSDRVWHCYRRRGRAKGVSFCGNQWAPIGGRMPEEPPSGERRCKRCSERVARLSQREVKP